MQFDYFPCNGCKWLQVAASGCKWLQVAASGCKWLQVAAVSKWLQVAAVSKWLQVAAPVAAAAASGCKWPQVDAEMATCTHLPWSIFFPDHHLDGPMVVAVQFGI